MVLVESIKVEKKIRKPYTDEERERMLRKCSSLRDKALLEFLYSTAVRVSELSEINREDIRYANVLLYRMAFLGMAVCLSLLYFL